MSLELVPSGCRQGNLLALDFRPFTDNFRLLNPGHLSAELQRVADIASPRLRSTGSAVLTVPRTRPSINHRRPSFNSRSLQLWNVEKSAFAYRFRLDSVFRSRFKTHFFPFPFH